MNARDKIIYTLESKRMPKKTGPYQIMDSYADIVTTDKDGIRNKLYIDRVKLAPTRSYH